MPSLNKLHEEIESKLDELRRTRQSHLTALGDELSLEKKKGPWSDRFTEHLSSIQDLRTALTEKNQTIEQWQALERELQTISDEKVSLEKEFEKLRIELEGHFEDIGAAAFELYKQSSSLFDETSELLEDMRQLEASIREKEKELRQLETVVTPPSFLGKTVNKGRGIVLRGGLKTRELQRVKRLKLVGEHICEFVDLAALPDDSSLSRRMASVGDFVDGFRRARRRMKELELDRERLEGGRVEIERGARMRNPVKNLQHEVRKFELELAEQLCELGGRFAGSNVDKNAVNQQVSKTLAAIDRNGREGTRYKKLLNRVEAGLAIETLEKQKKKLGGEIAGLSKKIEELETRTAGIDKEIAEKAALAGNPETLKMPERKPTSVQKKD